MVLYCTMRTYLHLAWYAHGVLHVLCVWSRGRCDLAVCMISQQMWSRSRSDLAADVISQQLTWCWSDSGLHGIHSQSLLYMFVRCKILASHTVFCSWLSLYQSAVYLQPSSHAASQPTGYLHMTMKTARVPASTRRTINQADGWRGWHFWLTSVLSKDSSPNKCPTNQQRAM